MTEDKKIVGKNECSGAHSSSSDSDPEKLYQKDGDAFRVELLELREQFVKFRETELFSLREQVSLVSFKFWRLSAILAAIVVILGGFGLKQFWDLDKMIDSTITAKFNESLSYFDRAFEGIYYARDGAYRSAIEIFRELSEKRPNDEVVFYSAMHCFNMLGEYEKGYELINSLKMKGLFPNKFKTFLSLNNAGWLVFLRSLQDPKFENEALELLTRAKEIGTVDEHKDLNLALQNLMYLHTAKGEEKKTKVYAERLYDSGYFKDRQWKDIFETEWFIMIKTKNPGAQNLLQNVIHSIETVDKREM